MNDGTCILVVDDEPAIRSFVTRVLVGAGYGTREAADGAEALALIRLDGFEPAAVLSDIVMPRMNGVELLQSLSTEWPGVPVILMSGYGTAQLEQRRIAVPCGVLRKPFSADLLLAEVRRCLEEAPPASVEPRRHTP